MIMTQEMIILLSTAAFLGFFHTLLGPDHYLPSIVMGKARQWSMAKTEWITVTAISSQEAGVPSGSAILKH